MSLSATQGSLFDDDLVEAPATEGIKYAGSKLKLIPHILRLVKKVRANTVFDGFSGTTRVSQALAKAGCRVICNDQAVWSETFGTCYLRSKANNPEYQKLIDHLNSVPPRSGWFTEHYGGEASRNGMSADAVKKPWQVHNTRKLDAVREEIDRLALDPIPKSIALTSLILALDQVDSTLGHFVSYLREWSPRSFNDMKLKIPMLVQTDREHEVYRRDIFELVPTVSADVAYYDPPYGSNNEKMPPSRVRYSSYYHVWTTVCLNDHPRLFGKANRRADTSDTVAASVFEEFRRNDKGRFIAVESIHRLLQQTQTNHVILSYSSGGRATSKELDQVIEDIGTLLEVVEIDYQKNVMSGMKWTSEWLRDAEEPNREFLFLIEKRKQR